MDQDTVIDTLSALAHPTRLAVFRLLVRSALNIVPALSIAEQLDAKPSTLASPLAIPKRADPFKNTRNHREIRYSAILSAIDYIVDFLLSDCCEVRISYC